MTAGLQSGASWIIAAGHLVDGRTTFATKHRRARGDQGEPPGRVFSMEMTCAAHDVPLGRIDQSNTASAPGKLEDGDRRG